MVMLLMVEEPKVSFDIGSIIIKASIELSCDGVLAQFLVLSTF